MRFQWALIIFTCFATGAIAEETQWQPTAATTASLRTGLARLTSSDAAPLPEGHIALITYWEISEGSERDVYRCVDVVAQNFEPMSQRCWKLLAPSGRSARATDP